MSTDHPYRLVQDEELLEEIGRHPHDVPTVMVNELVRRFQQRSLAVGTFMGVIHSIGSRLTEAGIVEDGPGLADIETGIRQLIAFVIRVEGAIEKLGVPDGDEP